MLNADALRWLFIIDAIITLPVAILGFVFLPGLPLQDKKEWWLKQDEHDLAISRLHRVGRAGREPWSKAKIRRLLSTWHTYLLREWHSLCLQLTAAFIYVLWNNGNAQPTMGFYLKVRGRRDHPR